MKTFRNPEEEVDSWRLQIYEETKDLTPEQLAERNRKFNEKTEMWAKQNGIRFIKNEINRKEVVQ